jgi:hypothetical protein
VDACLVHPQKQRRRQTPLPLLSLTCVFTSTGIVTSKTMLVWQVACLLRTVLACLTHLRFVKDISLPPLISVPPSFQRPFAVQPRHAVPLKAGKLLA